MSETSEITGSMTFGILIGIRIAQFQSRGTEFCCEWLAKGPFQSRRRDFLPRCEAVVYSATNWKSWNSQIETPLVFDSKVKKRGFSRSQKSVP